MSQTSLEISTSNELYESIGRLLGEMHQMSKRIEALERWSERFNECFERMEKKLDDIANYLTEEMEMSGNSVLLQVGEGIFPYRHG